MSANFERRGSFHFPHVPEMAKEVIFWCAVFTVAVCGAVLIGTMGTAWSVAIPITVHAAPAQPAQTTAVEGRRDWYLPDQFDETTGQTPERVEAF